MLKWSEPRPLVASLLLAAVTLACLLPFLGKAVHTDDPLFVWTARHIQADPAGFYRFNVNWTGNDLPMSVVTQNPPLAAYYLALIGSLLGWSEIALHFGFLLPAVAAVLGTYFLARHLCAYPFAAALAAVAAPGFLLCATTLMSDTMMVALWVWAAWLWIEGLRRKCSLRLALAAALITVCSLTKYFGVCLIPLLIAYSAMERRRVGSWLICLCLPVLVLAAYEWLTKRLYGVGLLYHAAGYANEARAGSEMASRILAGLAFTGGCVFLPLAAAGLLWGKKQLAAALVGVITVGLLLVGKKQVGVFPVVEDGRVHWLFVVQMAVMVVGGGLVLLLAATDAARHRTPASALLLLWTAGTFVFACGVNWTVAGRSILPLIPAVSFLVMRRMESRQPGCLWPPLAVSLAVALAVAWGDWKLADSARTAASDLCREFGPQGSGMAFEGHWGFQYYMQQLGARPLERDYLRLASKEVIVIPLGNTQLFPLPPRRADVLATRKFAASSWVCTMRMTSGAGFYSDAWGPAPFLFGPVPPEDYYLFRVK